VIFYIAARIIYCAAITYPAAQVLLPISFAFNAPLRDDVSDPRRHLSGLPASSLIGSVWRLITAAIAFVSNPARLNGILRYQAGSVALNIVGR